MEKTKETLWSDYHAVKKLIESLEPKDANYEMLLEERDKLRNELIKLDEAAMEVEIKKLQIEAENKREKTRNIINISTFAVTTTIGLWTVLKTFEFDEVGTFTGTLSRPSITNAFNKMFKK